MAKYVVVAPDGISASVSSNYGSATYNHGEISFNDNLARMFPSIFVKVDESAFEKIVTEPIADLKETISEVFTEIGEMFEESTEPTEPVAEETVEPVVEETVVPVVEETVVPVEPVVEETDTTVKQTSSKDRKKK